MTRMPITTVSHEPTYSSVRPKSTPAGSARPPESSMTLSATCDEPMPVTIANETRAKRMLMTAIETYVAMGTVRFGSFASSP